MLLLELKKKKKKDGSKNQWKHNNNKNNKKKNNNNDCDDNNDASNTNVKLFFSNMESDLGDKITSLDLNEEIVDMNFFKISDIKSFVTNI